MTALHPPWCGAWKPPSSRAATASARWLSSQPAAGASCRIQHALLLVALTVLPAPLALFQQGGWLLARWRCQGRYAPRTAVDASVMLEWHLESETRPWLGCAHVACCLPQIPQGQEAAHGGRRPGRHRRDPHRRCHCHILVAYDRVVGDIRSWQPLALLPRRGLARAHTAHRSHSPGICSRPHSPFPASTPGQHPHGVPHACHGPSWRRGRAWCARGWLGVLVRSWARLRPHALSKGAASSLALRHHRQMQS